VVFYECLKRGRGFTAGGAHDLRAIFDIEGQPQTGGIERLPHRFFRHPHGQRAVFSDEACG
jgi:hypothetical protein